MKAQPRYAIYLYDTIDHPDVLGHYKVIYPRTLESFMRIVKQRLKTKRWFFHPNSPKTNLPNEHHLLRLR